MPTTKVVLSGPLFTGEAAAAAKAYTDDINHELAEIARDWIKLDTGRMTKSGSDTGAASDAVKLSGGNGAWTISGGISKGKYAWPWLEGTSKRNQSTGSRDTRRSAAPGRGYGSRPCRTPSSGLSSTSRRWAAVRYERASRQE